MADMSEASVYKALGLGVPEAQGVQEQEPAEPVQTQPVETEPTQGVQEQEPAELVQGDADFDGENFEEGPSRQPEDLEQDGKKELTPEERRVNAARRRQQEKQAAIDAAVADARREEQDRAAEALTDLFAQAGMKNNFTGEAITNLEQFRAWQKQYREDQFQRDLAAGKLTLEGLNEMVAEHPIVKQFQTAMQQNQQPQTPEATDAQQTEAQRAVDEARISQEIAEIGKLDPTVKSLSDILNGPNAKEFYEHVNKGHNFLDAYRLANFERLTTAKAQAAGRQAMINDRGKDHMRGANNSRGTGALSVPSKDMAMFRTFNPNATEAQIQAYYNKYMKGR